MSARSFGSLFMVASCAGAALGCYLVSLRVASERASLEDVETQIVLAQRDMRMIQTEIGTRGRLSQLERWNAGAFALSAPAADQFLEGASSSPSWPSRSTRSISRRRWCSLAAPAPEKPAPLGSRAPTIPARRPQSSPSALLAPGKPEDRDARGPGKAGRHIAPGDRHEVHRQAGYGGEAGHQQSVDKPGLAAAQSRQAQDGRKPLAGNAEENRWISRRLPRPSR